jgi:hypothetical protein
MTITTPLRLITLHLSHLGFTLVLTFIAFLLIFFDMSRRGKPRLLFLHVTEIASLSVLHHLMR